MPMFATQAEGMYLMSDYTGNYSWNWQRRFRACWFKSRRKPSAGTRLKISAEWSANSAMARFR